MTKKFGLIGQTLKHSFSKSFFEKKFAELSIDAVYQNYELADITELPTVLKVENISGLNVTIPFKESILPFLDELDLSAKNVGAVNCIQFKNNKKIGHNTDAFGFKQLIKPFFESHHERAIILGTGGASKAVNYVLEELGVDVIYVSRNPKRRNEFSYDDMNQNMMAFNGIVVNTTPLGMFPNNDEFPNIPFQFLTQKHLVIDLIYNPKETEFMRRSKLQGAVVINGETMLHQQAEKSWEIWNS